jgi:hypothetical protein
LDFLNLFEFAEIFGFALKQRILNTPGQMYPQGLTGGPVAMLAAPVAMRWQPKASTGGQWRWLPELERSRGAAQVLA